MKITINDKDMDVNRIFINAKCSDLCFAQLQNSTGRVVAEHNGYVPALMPGEHYGDYICLEIDLKTGTILNWKRPSKKVIEITEWKVEEL